MERRLPSLLASSASWPLTPARLMQRRLRNLQKLKIDLNGDLAKIRDSRLKNEQLIGDVVRFLNTTGQARRIRPCDMDDPEEDACPAVRDR